MSSIFLYVFTKNAAFAKWPDLENWTILPFAETTSWCWTCSLRLWTTRPSSKRKPTRWQVCWVGFTQCWSFFPVLDPVYVSHSRGPLWLTAADSDKIIGWSTDSTWQDINEMLAPCCDFNGRRINLLSFLQRQINKWNEQRWASPQALTKHKEVCSCHLF